MIRYNLVHQIGATHMKRFAIIILSATSLLLAAAGQNAKQEKQNSDGKARLVPNPVLLLIRDPAIQADLQLRPDQKKTIRKVLDDIDGEFWAIRDLNAEQGGGTLNALVTKVTGELRKTLSTNQLKRLDQLILQGQGPDAIILPDVAKKLSLDKDQLKLIVKRLADAYDELDELAKQVTATNQKEIEAKAAKVREAGKELILDVLNEDQKKQWNAMLGKSFDMSKVKPPIIKAPELVSGDAWINSEPLTLEQLRGKVVAIHFWTFG